jgi:hypothetical protein
MALLHAISMPDRDMEDEDTIELQLTPTQLDGLARAAEEAERERRAVAAVPLAVREETAPTLVAVKNEVRTHAPPPSARGKRPYLTLAGAALVLALAVTVAYYLGARTRLTSSVPSPPTEVVEPAAQPPAATPPVPASKPPIEEIRDEPRGTPVRFRNPFDATEIFEFPPGTSPTEARDAVAELLIKRALEREPTWRSNGALRPPARPADLSVAQQRS